MTSNLEQFTLQKAQGACVVISSAYRNIRWSFHLLDYLLAQALRDARYRRIVAVALDRDPMEIRASLLAVSKALGYDGVDLSRLLLLDDLDLQQPFAALAAQGDAVFLYSLSELYLTHAALHLMPWMHAAMHHCNSSGVLLIANLHCSLHTPEVVAALSAHFPTVAKVQPNYGMMSDTVAAEVQTVRRSQSTGKVSEQMDMLVWTRGVLLPLVTNRKQKGGKEVQEKAQQEVQQAVQQVAGRLVTFDSTDPEFDEDSDPDADLDL